MSMTVMRSTAVTRLQRRPAASAAGRVGAAALALALAGVATVTCSLVLFLPDVLTGPAAMNGSARGTALVALVVAVPLLVAAVALCERGSARAVPVWLGSIAFLLYNSVLFVFASPFNDLFLPCVLMLSLAIWALVAALSDLDVEAFGRMFASSTPVRPVAAYIAVVAGANAVLWLAPVLRATFEDGPPAFLQGTGLTTNPVYVQDLAFWLPLLLLSAGWLVRRRPWGYVIASAGLVLWVIEGLSVAADQWLGHAADPASSVTSATLTPVVLVLAAIGLVPLLALLRGLPAGGEATTRSWTRHDVARRWLAGVAAVVAALALVGGLRMIHDGFGMPDRWLAGTGFDSWVLPGIALLVGVAVPQAAAAVLVARRRPVAVVVAVLAGTALVLWIVVQLALLQRFFFLQPVMAATGVLELALSVAATSPARGADVSVTVVRIRRT